jgi:bacterial/archaeal transporter family-2 protein
VTALAVALAAIAGLAGAVQAAVMGELGDRVGVFPAIAFSGLVSFGLGLVLLLAVEQSLGGLGEVAREPVWLWTGGALSVLIVLAITFAPPRIGVTATLGIVIAGTLVMGLVIDRFGLFGLERVALGWPRLVGVLLLAAGAALSLHRA